ncbi:unnamed protein product [Kuraishia capsulata CBS 1993]|uniref:TauD/TfdA-like domain-containing protein n=1 Tax=Kuraishia capsulata CBS 1993 TaxID=1382522 RepID=W6MH74_9ASCO|nr:uncharacterized protein KUCA_T00001268001 [Kuraishia capsulata CBS 1993]CDK25301.1 unnamed protein product [Kuraishia capsulata CBS 1993]
MSSVTEIQEHSTSSRDGRLTAVGDSSDGKPRWSNQSFDFTLPEDLRRVFPDYRTPDGVSAYLYAKEQGIQYPNYSQWKMEPYVEKTGFQDKGALSNPEKSALLRAAKEVIHLTPYCGTEIVGLKLTELSDEQKNDLARLAAERGVVVFRGQDDLFIREQIKFTSYFGEPHIHQQSGIIPDLPWSHIVYKDETSLNGLRSQVWHSDVPYELNSAGLTTMRFDLLPQAENGDFIGGDTLFANGYLIYEALDPQFRAWLETLKAKSSGLGQAAVAARLDMETRRPAFETEHPIVRTNPVTGLKSLYVAENFTTEIVGLEKRLSKSILDYLFDHIRRCLQFQCRIKWSLNDVAVWDNRSHFHTGIFDYFPKTRHGTRVIAQAERPYLAENSKLYSEVKFQGYSTT